MPFPGFLGERVRIIYPTLWSTLGRQASRDQTVSTVAALARRGHEVTLLMPRRMGEAELTTGELRHYFHVEGDFRLVQRDARRFGDPIVPSLLWLRQVFCDPELRGADLLYSRIPAMLAMGHLAPLPFTTDHYRLWPDELPALRPLFRLTSRHRRCAGLILHSEYAAANYRRAGVPGERMLVAHNGFDAREAPPSKNASRARLGLPVGRPIALYAGRISPRKGLDQILAIADLRPDVLFVLVGSEGDGPIERQAASRANVRVASWADTAALPAWLAATDVLLVPPSRAPLERFRDCVLPMKLFAYLAAGRPILAPASPDTAELLRNGETALLVEPEQPELSAAALDRLLDDAGLADRLAGNALRLASGLTWDRRAEKISAFLEARLGAIAELERLAQRSLYTSTVTPVRPTISGAAQAPSAAGK